MLALIFFEALGTLFLLSRVSSTLLPTKPPVQHIPDLNVATSVESPPPSPPTEKSMSSDNISQRRREGTIHHAADTASSSSRQGDGPKEHRGLAALRLLNAAKREDTFRLHEATATESKGRLYSTLDADEKTRIKRARIYLTTLIMKANRRGDFDFAHKSRKLVESLPTPYYTRHPPTGPLTPQQQAKLERSQKELKMREAKQARKFMEKEFGIAEVPAKKGRKQIDLSQVDPKRARTIAYKRQYYARTLAKSARNQGSTSIAGSSSQPSSTAQ